MIRDADDLKERIGRAAYVWSGSRHLRGSGFGARDRGRRRRVVRRPGDVHPARQPRRRLRRRRRLPRRARRTTASSSSASSRRRARARWTRTLARTAVGDPSRSPFVRATKATQGQGRARPQGPLRARRRRPQQGEVVQGARSSRARCTSACRTRTRGEADAVHGARRGCRCARRRSKGADFARTPRVRVARARRPRRARRDLRDHRRARDQAGARRRRQDDEPAGRARRDRAAAVGQGAARADGDRPRRLRDLAAAARRDRPRPGGERRREGAHRRPRQRHRLRDRSASPRSRSWSARAAAAAAARTRRPAACSTGPAGQVLVVIAGLVLIGVAGRAGRTRASRSKFLEKSKTEQMSEGTEKAFTVARRRRPPRAHGRLRADRLLPDQGRDRLQPGRGGRPRRRAGRARAGVLRARSCSASSRPA